MNECVTVAATDLLAVLHLARVDGTAVARLWAAAREQAPEAVDLAEKLASEGEALHWRQLRADV
jgi:hypothetical protein